MNQLELRSYPRAEIAEVLSVNINDSGHFKRNVESKLSKWGYGFRYETAAVEILSKPETPEERLYDTMFEDGFEPWEILAAAHQKILAAAALRQQEPQPVPAEDFNINIQSEVKVKK